jgi:predicted kinase
MLIWLNGSFGSGKTQTAYELHHRLPNSFVCDPEEIGYALRKMVPSALKQGDFQNFPMWRQFTYETLKYILQKYQGITIVPMTITDPEYHREIIARLREEGFEIHHFTLMASRQTLLKRLKGRGDDPHSWPAQQIDRCLNALPEPIFAKHFDTEGQTIEQVAEAIAQEIDLKLLPAKKNPILRRLSRILVQLRHIHFIPNLK